jgi:predicted ArsR family transcriptional regulator
MLEALRSGPGPRTLADLVAETGLHANTVREHLEALVDDGLARRTSAPPAGRGRPAALYQATDADPAAASEYAGLATTLAAVIPRTSATPTDDAIAAGRDWGRRLARGRGGRPSRGALAARREVVARLDEVGFGPRADARSATVRLTRCPLLEAAHEYPDVVCGVHLGLAQGALDEYGADPDGAELLPFAEPGACRLHLARPAR